MRRVTKENLITRIDRLYKIKDEQCQLSMNDEHNLQVYKMLLATMDAEPVVPTFDEWLEIRGNKPLGWVKDAMRESYDACRAAMLNQK